MKIYVITKGEYSSYHIVGVTTDKKAAQRLKKIHENKFISTRIEIYEDSFENSLPIYEVFADKETSSIEINRQDVPVYSIKKMGVIQETPSGYIFDVQAENKKAAQKIFFDALAQHKAEKEGIV